MTSTRNPAETRDLVVAAIVATAPDVDGLIEELDDDIDLFEEFGLDSMDRLNIMTSLAVATGVEIRDDQYPLLTTMSSLIGHVS